VEIDIAAGDAHLTGDLETPQNASGVVVFAHGSGSSRFSPRNRAVAESLRRRGMATVLMDLLTPEEDEEDRRTARLRFDIPLLARRLVAAIDRVRGEPELGDLPVGLFGASTGAAAAVVAAARRPEVVRAVVSRGGRPDLAEDDLPSVRAPTLLIVGGLDEPVIEMNREARKLMASEAYLVLVPNASHLFEEPGAMEQVAQLTGRWFTSHLPEGGPGLAPPGSP
jgi:pimeloyl-ACP methyl ester carboxylesterase